MNEFNLEEKECQCEKCIDMCRHITCWGTPSELNKIIDAGFGNKLMIDWWIASPEDIYVLCPANIGFELKQAPYHRDGLCSFFTKDNKCEIHNIKPVEGKTTTHDFYDSKLRDKISKLWNTPEGKSLIEEWKSKFGVKE